jgi:hypothetical protein
MQTNDLGAAIAPKAFFYAENIIDTAAVAVSFDKPKRDLIRDTIHNDRSRAAKACLSFLLTRESLIHSGYR